MTAPPERVRLIVTQLVYALQRAAALAFAAGLEADSQRYLAEADRHAETAGVHTFSADQRFDHPDERKS